MDNKNEELYTNEDVTGGWNSWKTYVVKTLNKLELKKSQLEDDITQLNREVIELSGQINHLKEQYNDTKEKYNNVREQYNTLKSDIHKDKILDTKDITELQTRVKGTSAIISTVIALVVGISIHVISGWYIQTHMEGQFEEKICPDQLVEEIVERITE